MPSFKDLTGQKFNRLMVVSRAEPLHNHTAWNCQCECGNSIVVTGNHLQRNNTTSCGCFGREVSFQNGKNNADADSGKNLLFTHYKSSAKRRSLSITLSKEQFYTLTSSECHYCGEPPSKLIKSIKAGNPYIYNGIDRVDNNLGYDFANCVPCCSICNHAKHVLSYEDFTRWINRLVRFRTK